MARQGLDSSMIYVAALDLIDREGLDGLTMRALGADLGVEAPSLYKHVHGKDDILDGAIDLVYSALEVGDIDEPWPDRVRRYSNTLRRAMLKHPNLAPVMATRPIVTTSTLRLVENVLHEVSEIGFEGEESVFVVNAMVSFTIGHVLSELSTDPAIGTDPDAIAAIRALLPADQFPRVLETLGRGVVDRDAEFRFAQELFIAGVEVMLARRG